MADLDAIALGTWLASRIDGLALPVEAAKFAGGQSNPTYRLTDASGRAFVLRKKPAGVLLPSAHAIDREYRVMQALRDTDVPVPRVVCFCEDTSVIGTAFYVMEHVEGRIFWDPALPDLDVAQRAAVYQDMARVIAQLHRIDPKQVGLESFGKSGHFLQRQVDRWTRQYRASETEPIEAMDRLIDWLPRHLPPPRPAVIFHGDLRIDNMIFHPSEPRVIAVLDWELSTLGDPIADFAYHTLPWRLATAARGMAGKNLAALGIPDETSHLRTYCKLAGRGPVDAAEWEFCRAYGQFRFAAILQGVFKRALDGNASSAQALALGSQARGIAEDAWSQVDALA